MENNKKEEKEEEKAFESVGGLSFFDFSLLILCYPLKSQRKQADDLKHESNYFQVSIIFAFPSLFANDKTGGFAR